jgi:hypothetical protein
MHTAAWVILGLVAVPSAALEVPRLAEVHVVMDQPFVVHCMLWWCPNVTVVASEPVRGYLMRLRPQTHAGFDVTVPDYASDPDVPHPLRGDQFGLGGWGWNVEDIGTTMAFGRPLPNGTARTFVFAFAGVSGSTGGDIEGVVVPGDAWVEPPAKPAR